MTILNDLKDLLYTSGIFDDYGAHSYFGINDSNATFKGAIKWTAFKIGGGGRVDPIYGEPRIRLWIGGSTNNQSSRYSDANSIINFVNANPSNGAIIHILVQSDVNGPYSLEGGRSYFEINLRLTQARG